MTYQIRFADPNIQNDNITREIESVLYSGYMTNGKNCRRVEREFERIVNIDAPLDHYAITVSSCMAALHLAYLTLGIGRGDDVIVPALTHVATAHAVELTGARPIFVDCESDGNIAVEKIEKNITRNTKAISVVHYNGFPCNMEAIRRIAHDYDLYIIEDCALSLGTLYKNQIHTGRLGTIGCFSFYPTKHITSGEGGMFITQDIEIYHKAKQIMSFGYCSDISHKYNVNTLGLNYRMTEMQAIILYHQLLQLNDKIQKRRENFEYFYAQFSELITNSEPTLIPENCFPYERHNISPYSATIMFNQRDRNDAMEFLRKEGVESTIHYPHPVPRLEYYRNKYGYRRKEFINAIRFADCSLSLPIGPHIEKEHIDQMIEFLRR